MMVTQNASVKAPRPDIGEGSLRVARLTKPHGLKGALKVELYTDNPELRFQPGAKFYLQVPEDSPWFDKTLTLTVLRWFSGQPVAFFDELKDRTAAESVTRAILWITEEQVAAGREDDAWYDQELVGMSVLLDGAEVGKVREVQHMPAQDLLAVDTQNGVVLVPFVKEIVPEVNLEKREIIVIPPAGLFADE